MNTADLLRAIRRARGLSQRELATTAQLPRSTIERIESPHPVQPTLTILERILHSAGYRLAILDDQGEVLELDADRFSYWDQGGRRFPAHLVPYKTPTRWRAMAGGGQGWWGYGHIAFDYFGDPKAPPYTFRRRMAAVTEFDAIVLAGGRATRMGGIDKPMQPVQGLPMLRHVLSAVSAAGLKVVVGHERAGVDGVVWTREEPAGSGPVAAVAAGLTRTTAEFVLVLAADLPNVAPAVPRLLAAMRQPCHAAVLHTNGRDNYLAAIWRRGALGDRLKTLPGLENAPMRALYDGSECIRVEDPAGWGRDVDTLSDLQRENLDDLSG